MHHKSKNGLTYEIGSLVGYDDGKSYDIVVILNWNNVDVPVEIVDYYFGEYEYDTTEHYINESEGKK